LYFVDCVSDIIMGCLCPRLCPRRDATTAMIDDQQQQDEWKDQKIIKLLFLGAGGSGKSTLFKQLRILYGDGLEEEARLRYTKNIYCNLIDGIKALLDGNLEMAAKDDDEVINLSRKGKKTRGVKVIPCEEKIMSSIDEISENDTLSPEIAKLIQMAWSDPGMKMTWERRSELQIQDSLAYYVENVERIAQPGWIPSKDDVLHVRSVTTGIVEEDMKIRDRIFHIVDVGGQRSERRKWMNCFDDVTGLIYVASLISYNQTLYEDESTNRMKESLTLFHKTVKGKDGNNFKNSCVVLFLNKEDLFTEMIKNYPITRCFPEYKGRLTELEQYNYISKKYQDVVAPRQIFVHRTCATSTDQIQVIFNVVNLEIIRKALAGAGFLLT